MNITNLELAQATIQIFCGLLCILAIIIISASNNNNKSHSAIKWMFFCVSFNYFGEACAYIFRGNVQPLALVLNQTADYIVFISNCILIIVFIRYIYALIEEAGAKPDLRYMKLTYILMTVNLICIFINLFTGWMFTFDQQNYYHRNYFWYIYTVICSICSVFPIILCIQNRHILKRNIILSVMFYILMPLIATILQVFLYGWSILNIGIGVALVLVLVTYVKNWSNSLEIDDDARKKGQHSLDTVILLCIMVISMAASIVTCIISIDRISDDMEESDSKTIAHMVSDSIDIAFLEPITVAETMSNDYSMLQNMKKSGEISPTYVEEDFAEYLESIREAFGYQMVFAVCDKSRAYYTYNGIAKYINTNKNKNGHDIWYKMFCDSGKHYDLDVDTDEANHWDLSVFVNTEIRDEENQFLGVCGVGVEMSSLQSTLEQYEKEYGVRIYLVDETGLIQVSTNAQKIEIEHLDASYFSKVNSADFYYEQLADTNRLTKYMDNLEWYLVIEDNHANKIQVLEITLPSIMIFVIGLVAMGIGFGIMLRRERRINRELQEKRLMSLTDELTGVKNRRAFQEDCTRLQDTDKSDLVMIMMDLNGLKETNDTMGHMAGDELIIGASNCMITVFSEFGRIYRIGGDEFVALLRCSREQAEDAFRTFEHLSHSWKGRYIREISISRGIVVFAEHENLSMEEAKQIADQLMYEDKEIYYQKTGKNRRLH